MRRSTLVATFLALSLSVLTLYPWAGLVLGALVGHDLWIVLYGHYSLFVDVTGMLVGLGAGMLQGARVMVQRVIAG
jgi:hypothetical protein